MFAKAKLIDFTGSVAGFDAHERFNERIVAMLRDGHSEKTVVVIDRGHHMPSAQAHVITDHINASGDNPLTGPNNECGERFPVVNSIYVHTFNDEVLDKLPRGVAVGIKHGATASDSEMEELRKLGCDFCCHNIVPTMIVAAHAGWKVVGIALPAGAKLDENVVKRLTGK
ncbi:MAG TPA: hypothetical protein V6C81_29135 [Planktothrix sp.]